MKFNTTTAEIITQLLEFIPNVTLLALPVTFTLGETPC